MARVTVVIYTQVFFSKVLNPFSACERKRLKHRRVVSWTNATDAEFRDELVC